MTHKLLLLFLFISFLNCSKKQLEERERIDISGEWQFALDTTVQGETNKWFNIKLSETVTLPGTLDENKKGFLNTDTTTLHLNRIYKYEGAAWYRKEIVIPQNFKDQELTLFLERTKTSKVWIDSIYIGTSHILQTPQNYNVSKYLTPGKHSISILINNDLRLTPYGNVHIYSDDTQTNWNGIIGNMYIEAKPKVHIKKLKLTPNITNKTAQIEISLSQVPKPNSSLEIQIESYQNGKHEVLPIKTINNISQENIQFLYDLKDSYKLWDEYQQPLYKLKVYLKNNGQTDVVSTHFGMREFKAENKQFQINNRTTFLRGKHDAAVFPITGYTPTDVESWKKIYQTAKSYGINHYRFHSYCPPEAAFTAADEEGMYLQAELPFWSGMEADSLANMQYEEGLAMLDTYGNHPSFVMFSPGNEIWGGHDNVEKNINKLKAYDNRVLYTMGCNNHIGYAPPRSCSDFFVCARTPFEKDSILTHTRLTHAFADSFDGGILNTTTPNTLVNYKYPVNQLDIPIISHEIGQYQIYPNYKETEKYTGVLKPNNLEVFKERLKKKGMAKMDSSFQKASGAWAALCYKAEMEAALRTEHFAGFQLLDLQDFPGQGTALVGILDAFMDSKEVVTQKAWKESCNDVVILAEFPKYCWTNDSNFNAAIKIANYSNKTINNSISWSLLKEDGSSLKSGEFHVKELPMGKLSEVGMLNIPLSNLKTNEKLELKLKLLNTEYTNVYPIWIYQPIEKVNVPKTISVVNNLSKNTFNNLQAGEKVLLFPDENGLNEESFKGHFPPEFWNYGMFKTISEHNGKPVSPGTLGLFTNPKHPIFDYFPTDFHTNWQWFSIIKASKSLVLDETNKDYLPVVQIIDNLERNHKLGLIFEFKIGKGKLLVCMSQLDKLKQPEALHLYQSILNYMDSEAFNPQTEVSLNELEKLFKIH